MVGRTPANAALSVRRLRVARCDRIGRWVRRAGRCIHAADGFDVAVSADTVGSPVRLAPAIGCRVAATGSGLVSPAHCLAVRLGP